MAEWARNYGMAVRSKVVVGMYSHLPPRLHTHTVWSEPPTEPCSARVP